MIIKRDPDTLKSYLEDSSNLSGGYAEGIAIPENIDELSSFLKEASSNKTPVTISGGGTATTGSRVPFGGYALSLEKFNRILAVSSDDKYVCAESGVFVEDIRRACEDKGLFFTSHPTESTATIGGTVATNASGARSFKYGPMRKYVRRLKMVMATGQILDIKRGQRSLSVKNSVIEIPGLGAARIPLPSYRMPNVKNAAGYYAYDGMDLLDLFIGQEGTLSVITEVELGLERRPEKIFSAFVFFKNESDSWSFAARAGALSKEASKDPDSMIDALSIEYFDSNALSLLKKKNPNVPENAKAAIFFEQEVTSNDVNNVVDSWVALISKHGASADDTWVAMTKEEGDKFSQLRHSIPESVNEIIRARGIRKISADIAVPRPKFIEMMEFYRDKLGSLDADHIIFGHIGECHVHVNILPKSEAQASRARELVMEFVRKGVQFGGTVSAEHGIGKIKHKYLEEMYGASGIAEMIRIKKALDPNCILGLDNIFSKNLLKSI